jgi:alkanesulfonate monooxygenase SsuD/methylene tetrahydromethanopterin reductase-like flavin-dependent oxidoreductase (luciferase family)
MKYGLTLPIFNQLADPTTLADLAADAEDHGWDGVFVWDHVYYRRPAVQVTDPWISLAAMALRTQRITLGPMVTPLARRRPQVLARTIVALDHLSRGRVVLGVGLGLDGSGAEFTRFGEDADVKQRAERYDEALELLQRMLTGEPFSHAGNYFTASDVQFLPTPVQPRIPVWAAARWPNRRPLARAARCDGVFVIDIEPANLPTVVVDIQSQRQLDGATFDVVVESPAGPDTEIAHEWASAGATWMLSTFDPFTVTSDDVRAQIRRRGSI